MQPVHYFLFAVQVLALIVVVIFYLSVRKTKKNCDEPKTVLVVNTTGREGTELFAKEVSIPLELLTHKHNCLPMLMEFSNEHKRWVQIHWALWRQRDNIFFIYLLWPDRIEKEDEYFNGIDFESLGWTRIAEYGEELAENWL